MQNNHLQPPLDPVCLVRVWFPQLVLEFLQENLYLVFKYLAFKRVGNDFQFADKILPAFRDFLRDTISYFFMPSCRAGAFTIKILKLSAQLILKENFDKINKSWL